MKKLLLLVTLMVSIVGVMFAENKADFNTMNGGKTITSYGSLTSTNKWKTQNCALLSPTNANGELAPTLNGKTSAVGVVTSPVISGGVGTISFDYTNTFKETNGVELSISIKKDNVEVASTQLKNNSVTQNQKYSFSFQFNIAGDFSIEVKNLSPSSNSSSNKDRVSIWNLTWTSYSSGETDEVGVPSITYKDVAVTESQTITEGESIVVNAEKAQKIDIFDETETFASSTTLPYTWTPEFIGTKQITVGATNGTAYEKITFSLTVIEAPKTLGDIVVTYGDGKIVPDNSVEPITVEVGTEFTATAENATYITVRAASGVIAKEPNNTVSWSFNDVTAQGVEVTASLEGEEDKVFMFNVQVVEPVIPEDEIWTLVTSSDDLVIGGKYIIAAKDVKLAMANTNNTNNRKSTEVTIYENSILNPSETVLRLTLEKDGDTWLWRTLNYIGTNGDIANPQVYLNSESNNNRLFANNPTTANLNRRNSSIEFDDNANAIIKFVNCVKSNVTRQIYYNGMVAGSGGLTFNCFVVENEDYKPVQIYRLIEPQPEVPTFDQMEDVATKVSMTSTKGELHVWTMEYDKDGKLVKENGEEMPVSIMAKAPADDKTWTNKVADEGVTYEIDVPTTDGNYLTIRAKSVLNGLHSEELVKNVDASGNVISGVEGVVADDENAPVEYFNLQGVRVAADQPGIYIRRQGSKVEKVSIAR